MCVCVCVCVCVSTPCRLIYLYVYTWEINLPLILLVGMSTSKGCSAALVILFTVKHIFPITKRIKHLVIKSWYHADRQVYNQCYNLPI